MGELFPYPFITLKETDLGNTSLGDMLNLRGVSQHITANAKYHAPDCENMPLAIQMQLS